MFFMFFICKLMFLTSMVSSSQMFKSPAEGLYY